MTKIEMQADHYYWETEDLQLKPKVIGHLSGKGRLLPRQSSVLLLRINTPRTYVEKNNKWLFLQFFRVCFRRKRPLPNL